MEFSRFESCRLIMWKELFDALLIDSRKRANAFEIAKHVVKISLYEKKGIEALYPDVKEKAQKLIIIMELKKMPIEIFETFRNIRRQNELYAQGRTEPGNIVTNAKPLEGYHFYGLAFDICFKTYGWNPPQQIWWEIVGEEGKKLGLIWGGERTIRDYGHFEWHPTFTWQELKPYFEIQT